MAKPGRPKKYDGVVKVPLTKRQRDALETTAMLEGANLAEVIRRAIDAYVSRDKELAA